MWHDRGNKLEEICKKELAERYKNHNFRLINAKINSVHGIDFAYSLNNDSNIFIAEVKSATGSVKGEQMSPQWIKERVLNPKNEVLYKAILQCINNKGHIIAASYRVDDSKPVGQQLSGMSPTYELKSEDLIDENDFNLKNQSAVLTKTKNIMANNNVLDGQIELLEHLKTKLTGFVDQLEEAKTDYEKTVDDLEISGLEQHFLDRFIKELDEMKKNIDNIIKDIEVEDIPFIDKAIDFLENPPV